MVLFVGVVLLVVDPISLLTAPNLVIGLGGTNGVDALQTFRFFALP